MVRLAQFSSDSQCSVDIVHSALTLARPSQTDGTDEW